MPGPAGNEASALPGCRFSVAAHPSSEGLFEDHVEEPAADIEMHIPNDKSKKGKGRGKVLVQTSDSSAEEDQSKQHEPST